MIVEAQKEFIVNFVIPILEEGRSIKYTITDAKILITALMSVSQKHIDWGIVYDEVISVLNNAMFDRNEPFRADHALWEYPVLVKWISDEAGKRLEAQGEINLLRTMLFVGDDETYAYSPEPKTS